MILLPRQGHVRNIGRYTLKRKILVGNPKRGIPELWLSQDAGDIYYIKIWQKNSGEETAIQGLWNREVRGLMRLQSYPGASELFVKLRDLDSDDKRYYAVIEGGRNLLLEQALNERARYPWLVNLSEASRRRALWEGLLKIARAVGLLHREGTLHRSLGPGAVFVDPEGLGEFRLSGFEWSLRVSGNGNGNENPVADRKFSAPELDKGRSEYSTATDWFDYGLLCGEVFGLPVKSISKRSAIQTIISDIRYLRDAERAIIADLLLDDQDARLTDTEEIEQRLAGILSDLGAVTSSATRSLTLAMRLGPDREISQRIEVASERLAKADDPISQRNWIQRDIEERCQIIGRTSPNFHYVLKGAQLEYRLSPWSLSGSETWDVAFCERLERKPRVSPDDQVFVGNDKRIEVQLYPHVRSNFSRARDRSAPWNKTFPINKPKLSLPPDLRTIHEFFRVTQQLDAVVIAAQICAAEVRDVDYTETETFVSIAPVHEPARSDLAKALKLASPADQLSDLFRLGASDFLDDDDTDTNGYGDFSLLDRPTIGSETSTIVWKFVRSTSTPATPVYVFKAPGRVPEPSGRVYLARNHGGNLAQLKRRHKAIDDLRLFGGLLRYISAPHENSRTTTELSPISKPTVVLDDRKRDILERIWRTYPAFAVQGPPGTGKTTLLQAFLERLLSADMTAQVLVTAHSHHTVDDVRRKTTELLEKLGLADDLIMVRLGGPASDSDPSQIAERILQRLSRSELGRTAPEKIRARIDNALGFGRQGDESADFRTMQLLVQDAANITYCTLNSSGLADLADRGRRFDWSVIEEAGKAHGFDMATALQESHRLLLIGDHHQLPPFNVDRFVEILSDPARVKNAIETGSRFAPSLIDPSLVVDDDTREPLEQRCADWLRMIRFFGALFERGATGQYGVSSSATLTSQHRMHPHIADLVGRVFYPDEGDGTLINSPVETVERFKEPPPFLIKSDSWMPEHRLVWCDIEWIQKDKFAEGEVEGLFASEVEANCVSNILNQFSSLPDLPCEVQILSPYNNQLRAIRATLESQHASGQLEEMFHPPFDLMSGKRMGATVDEFQGSEADLVVVSLVRNNGLVPRKSIGFLKERNRMNVLLSRAKHKLIIVGSWEFFATRCDEFTSDYDDHSYLADLMREVEAARKSGRLARIVAPK